MPVGLCHLARLVAGITPRVLLPMHGSGNWGESAASAFYTIDELPPSLLDLPLHASQPLQRDDLDLGPDRLAFVIDDVLGDKEADALAACSEAILEHNGNSRVAPGIQTPPGMRVNMAAHWYAPRTEGGFYVSLLERFKHLVPPTLGGLPLYSTLSEKIASFKYLPGDRFERHTDGLFPGQGANDKGDGIDIWPGVESGMSILIYLNGAEEGLKGGETRLWSADGSRWVDVTPKKGRALFFRRGSPDAVQHAGLPVDQDSERPKIMALINLAYGVREGTEPFRV